VGPEPSPSAASPKAAAALRRVLELIASVLKGLRRLAIVAGVAVTGAWLAWALQERPASASAWGVAVLVLALALAPSAVLFVFVGTVNAVRELPARYRDLPADVRERASHVRDARERGGLLGTIGSLIELVRVAASSREVLSPFATIAAALRPTTLIGALLAVLGAVIEIPIAIVVLVLAVL
jgi:hypothetical protein